MITKYRTLSKTNREKLYELSANYIENNKPHFLKQGKLTIPYFLFGYDDEVFQLNLNLLTSNSVFFRDELLTIINKPNYAGLMINDRININNGWDELLKEFFDNINK